MNTQNDVNRRGTLVSIGRAAARPLAAVGLTAAGVSSAHAAAFTLDTADVITTITNGVTALSAIGIAVLSLVVVIKLFKWAQRTL